MDKVKFLTQAKTEGLFGKRYEDGSAYSPGEHVVKDGVVYVCLAAITAVPAYDSTKAYAAGDLVRYPGDTKLEKGVYSCDSGVPAGKEFTISDWTFRRMWDATKWEATTVDDLKQDKADAVKRSDFSGIDPNTVTIAQLARLLKGESI